MGNRIHRMLIIYCPKCLKKEHYHFIGSLPLSIAKEMAKDFHCQMNGKWRIQKFIEFTNEKYLKSA